MPYILLGLLLNYLSRYHLLYNVLAKFSSGVISEFIFMSLISSFTSGNVYSGFVFTNKRDFEQSKWFKLK